MTEGHREGRAELCLSQVLEEGYTEQWGPDMGRGLPVGRLGVPPGP